MSFIHLDFVFMMRFLNQDLNEYLKTFFYTINFNWAPIKNKY